MRMKTIRKLTPPDVLHSQSLQKIRWGGISYRLDITSWAIAKVRSISSSV